MCPPPEVSGAGPVRSAGREPALSTSSGRARYRNCHSQSGGLGIICSGLPLSCAPAMDVSIIQPVARISGRSIRHQVYENRPWGLSLGRPPARAVRSYPGTRSPAGAAGSRDAMYPGRFGAWLVVNVFRISRHSEGAIVFSGAFRARVRAGCRGFMAWMPRSCRKNDMVVAFTSYGLAGRNRGRGISGHGSSPGARGTRGKAWGRGGGRRGGGAGGGGRRGLSGPFGIN